MLISIATHITCDFPGGGEGGSESLSPLWIRTWRLAKDGKETVKQSM